MTIVFKISDKTKEVMIDYFKNKKRDKTPPYAIFQADEADTVITLYESNKVVFQGVSADIDANIWRAKERQLTGKDVVEKNKKDKAEKKDKLTPNLTGSIIGSDEVGTGDFFGPIVVTAAYVKNISDLADYPIQDTKKMDDNKIKEIVPEIIDKVQYKTIILNNVEYNKKYSKNMNMNKIKAILHNKVLTSLKNEVTDKIDYIVIDQFAKEKKYYEYLEGTTPLKGLTFLEKAEDQVLSVAVAAMISRFILLQEFDKMSDKYHIVIPKGASTEVDKIGKEIVEKYGEEELSKIAKLNFKNVQKIKEEIN